MQRLSEKRNFKLIEVDTGLRQGDGLSPFIFNLAVEEAIKKSNSHNLTYN